jgi:Na+-driven multidrug efflux pump
MHYACTAFPGLLFGGLADVDKRFLKIFKRRYVVMTNQLIRIILYPLWLYIFIISWKMNTVGYALVFTIDNFLKLVINWFFIKCSKNLSKHLISLNLEYFERIDSKLEQFKTCRYTMAKELLS